MDNTILHEKDLSDQDLKKLFFIKSSLPAIAAAPPFLSTLYLSSLPRMRKGVAVNNNLVSSLYKELGGSGKPPVIWNADFLGPAKLSAMNGPFFMSPEHAAKMHDLLRSNLTFKDLILHRLGLSKPLDPTIDDVKDAFAEEFKDRLLTRADKMKLDDIEEKLRNGETLYSYKKELYKELKPKAKHEAALERLARKYYNKIIESSKRGLINIPNKVDPGILLHELGHATSPLMKIPGYGWLYHNAKHIPLISSIIMALSPVDKKDLDNKLLAASAVSSMPLLAEEFQASLRGALKGSKLLKAHGLSKLSPFIGFPTYLLGVLAPFLVYGAKRFIDKEFVQGDPVVRRRAKNYKEPTWFESIKDMFSKNAEMEKQAGIGGRLASLIGGAALGGVYPLLFMKKDKDRSRLDTFMRYVSYPLLGALGGITGHDRGKLLGVLLGAPTAVGIGAGLDALRDKYKNELFDIMVPGAKFSVISSLLASSMLGGGGLRRLSQEALTSKAMPNLLEYFGLKAAPESLRKIMNNENLVNELRELTNKVHAIEFKSKISDFLKKYNIDIPKNKKERNLLFSILNSRSIASPSLQDLLHGRPMAGYVYMNQKPPMAFKSVKDYMFDFKKNFPNLYKFVTLLEAYSGSPNVYDKVLEYGNIRKVPIKDYITANLKDMVMGAIPGAAVSGGGGYLYSKYMNDNNLFNK